MDEESLIKLIAGLVATCMIPRDGKFDPEELAKRAIAVAYEIHQQVDRMNLRA